LGLRSHILLVQGLAFALLCLALAAVFDLHRRRQSYLRQLATYFVAVPTYYLLFYSVQATHLFCFTHLRPPLLCLKPLGAIAKSFCQRLLELDATFLARLPTQLFHSNLLFNLISSSPLLPYQPLRATKESTSSCPRLAVKLPQADLTHSSGPGSFCQSPPSLDSFKRRAIKIIMPPMVSRRGGRMATRGGAGGGIDRKSHNQDRSRNTRASSSATAQVIITGWAESKASTNSSGAIPDLIKFLERKAGTANEKHNAAKGISKRSSFRIRKVRWTPSVK
jgi:hypothetical protein